MTTKYTPGPWHVQELAETLWIWNADKSKIIAYKSIDTSEDKDIDLTNMKIAAAAPELLDALIECQSDLFYQIASKHNPQKARQYPSIVKATKAIARALGEKEDEA